MPSHQLIIEKGSSQNRWLLQWDRETFVLKPWNGEPLFNMPTVLVHRTLETYELYVYGKASFATDDGSLTFKPHPAAVRDLRELYEDGLAIDQEYRLLQKRRSWLRILLGMAGGGVGATLLTVCIRWAGRPPNPSVGSGASRFVFRLLIFDPFLVLFAAMTLAGPMLCYFAFKDLRRIWRIERSVR